MNLHISFPFVVALMFFLIGLVMTKSFDGANRVMGWLLTSISLIGMMMIAFWPQVVSVALSLTR